jgi:predicted nucleic acid-binding protein
MSTTLVDSNVLLDLVTDDPKWADWSIRQLDGAAIRGTLAINDIVYAEISVRFTTIEALDTVLNEAGIAMAAIPRPALFLAGKAFQRYRAAGGARTGVLPDLFIGAHAAVAGLTLLTRDVRRYRTYFPTIDLITPAADRSARRRLPPLR